MGSVVLSTHRMSRCSPHRGRRSHGGWRPLLAGLSAALGLAGASGVAAGPPPEERCPTLGGGPGASSGEDAIPTPLREGMLLHREDLLRLRQLLPPEIWRLREVFFHDGMRMEIGPCHRRYPVPEFHAKATAELGGRARLDAEGNLRGHLAGVPFPPDSIDPTAEDAGARWAWNLALRYRGAGPSGSFRITDFPSRTARAFEYFGSFFFLQTAHRADLRESGYALREAERNLWVSGGRFEKPFNVRHVAWRQLRPLETESAYREPDDTFVYVPTMRKVRRSATAWVDGIYTPKYRVGSLDDGGGLAVGGDPFSGPQGGLYPTASRSTYVTEDMRAGFTGLSLRPNAYRWQVLGEREVLAPLNGTRSGYPLDRDRNFGPSGLSVGSDRWDVRWAVVLRGIPLDRGGPFSQLVVWLDYQTQQPLYWITKQRSGEIVDIAVLVHRFSGDLSRYPEWPDGGRALVFDPVATVSYSPIEGGTGWRRESYDSGSLPPEPELVQRYVSTDSLLRGN